MKFLWISPSFQSTYSIFIFLFLTSWSFSFLIYGLIMFTFIGFINSTMLSFRPSLFLPFLLLKFLSCVLNDLLFSFIYVFILHILFCFNLRISFSVFYSLFIIMLFIQCLSITEYYNLLSKFSTLGNKLGYPRVFKQFVDSAVTNGLEFKKREFT